MFFPSGEKLADTSIAILFVILLETLVFKSKIYIYKAIADIKWASWAFIQDKLSTLDFDFYKYGALKFLRARDFIINNNWSKSLGRIK